jgi:hypothetical protein
MNYLFIVIIIFQCVIILYGSITVVLLARILGCKGYDLRRPRASYSYSTVSLTQIPPPARSPQTPNMSISIRLPRELFFSWSKVKFPGAGACCPDIRAGRTKWGLVDVTTTTTGNGGHLPTTLLGHPPISATTFVARAFFFLPRFSRYGNAMLPRVEVTVSIVDHAKARARPQLERLFDYLHRDLIILRAPRIASRAHSPSPDT